MTQEEISFLKNMLLNRRIDLMERVRKIAAAWQELEERSIEIEEEAQKASISRPYVKLDHSGKVEIEQIDLALTKMTLGDYGVCEACGDDIDPRRLQAVPWARLCIDCAREFENKKIALPSIHEAVGEAEIPPEFLGLSGEQVVQSVYERLQGEHDIDVDEVVISFGGGVLYLDGTVPGDSERDALVRFLGEKLGFTITDRLRVEESALGVAEHGESSENDGLAGRLFEGADDSEGDFYEAGQYSEPRNPFGALNGANFQFSEIP